LNCTNLAQPELLENKIFLDDNLLLAKSIQNNVFYSSPRQHETVIFCL
jgi:hypothetical protein